MVFTVKLAAGPFHRSGFLKAQLLIAPYSTRSDRLLCETLDYNILSRWLLDMWLEEVSFDDSRNCERLAGKEVAMRFFDAAVREARALDLVPDEHFSVDGTLIEAWAAMKSFRPKDGGGSTAAQAPSPEERGRQGLSHATLRRGAASPAHRSTCRP
jgi:hypothetical protein